MAFLAKAEHVYVRPAWDCALCEQPWPCANAKIGLAEEYASAPTVLSLYMALCLYDALDDMAATVRPAPPDLFERFLGWFRRLC